MDDMTQILVIALEVVFIAMVSFLAWFSKRSIARIDQIEQNYVKREEFRQELRQLRSEVHDGHNQISTQLREIYHLMINKNNNGGEQ